MLGPTFSPWVDIDLEVGLEAFDRALRAAVALRTAGLEFVHAPVVRPDGGVLARLGEDYAVSVFAFVDGESRAIDEYSDEQRGRVLEALGRMHAASGVAASGIASRDSLTVPFWSRFLATLDDLGSPWTGGAFGEAARLLLRESADALRDVFDRGDALADAVRAAENPWVVTHGGLFAPNVIFAEHDRLLLVDLDNMCVAPRERDLRLFEPLSDRDWAAYVSGGSSVEMDPVAVDLYRHVGDLWCVCTLSEDFRSPHVGDADIRHQWMVFQNAVSRSVRLLE